MLTVSFVATTLAQASALVSLGGGFYETIVVNPYWPARPDIIQPRRGGINRKWFWIPAHTVFELSLLTALIAGWSQVDLRNWLLVGFASHLVMRLWSAVDFIPKAWHSNEPIPAQSMRKRLVAGRDVAAGGLSWISSRAERYSPVWLSR